MERLHIGSGAPWEEAAGYSRALRTGNQVEVSGTVALQDGRPVAPGDPYAQARRIFEIIEEALLQAGARLEDVVRTRLYVTDIGYWEEVARAHGEVFGHIRPATSLIEVSALIGPEFLVEVEATAIIAQSGNPS